MDIVQVVKEFGLPIALVIGVLLFLRNTVWPFVVGQIAKSEELIKTEREQRQEERSRFLAELDKRHSENEQIIVTLNSLVVSSHIIQQNLEEIGKVLNGRRRQR